MRKPDCEADRRFKAKVIMAYAEAINKIDDYFEYRYESERDKEVVRAALLELNKSLHRIRAEDFKNA